MDQRRHDTWVITKRELAAFFVRHCLLVGAAFLFITVCFFFLQSPWLAWPPWPKFSMSWGGAPVYRAILTMRLLAEEARSGTLELLVTSPVRDWEGVLVNFWRPSCSL